MYIHAEKFLSRMHDLYDCAGWDRKEVHFSLEDLKMNILSEEPAQVINKDALLFNLKNAQKFNSDCPDWVFQMIEQMF